MFDGNWIGAAVQVLARQGALDGPEIARRQALHVRQKQLRAEAAALEASAIPNLHATWRTALPAVRSEVVDMGGKAPGISRQVERSTLRQIVRATASMSKRAGRREARVQLKRRRAGLG